jgi:hypothetical protein
LDDPGRQEVNLTATEARVSIPSDVLFHELDGEAVLLNLQTGKYFGLDPMGTRIWQLLVEHGSPAMAYNILLEEYDVDAERLETEMLSLVDQLAAHGLIRLDPVLDSHES